jgi:hypothetical protein
MKKVKNVLKLMFFGRNKNKERGGKEEFQTEPMLTIFVMGKLFDYSTLKIY